MDPSVLDLYENTKNNTSAEVLSIVQGEKTFIGTFSINDRSKIKHLKTIFVFWKE